MVRFVNLCTQIDKYLIDCYAQIFALQIRYSVHCTSKSRNDKMKHDNAVFKIFDTYYFGIKLNAKLILNKLNMCSIKSNKT